MDHQRRSPTRAPGGAFTGRRGFFTRDDNGAVTGFDLAGRLFNLFTLAIAAGAMPRRQRHR